MKRREKRESEAIGSLGRDRRSRRNSSELKRAKIGGRGGREEVITEACFRSLLFLYKWGISNLIDRCKDKKFKIIS